MSRSKRSSFPRDLVPRFKSLRHPTREAEISFAHQITPNVISLLPTLRQREIWDKVSAESAPHAALTACSAPGRFTHTIAALRCMCEQARCGPTVLRRGYPRKTHWHASFVFIWRFESNVESSSYFCLISAMGGG